VKGFATRSLAIWFGLLAFDGLFRYEALALGIPWIVYAKDALLLVLLGIFAIQVIVSLRVYATILVVMSVISYGVWVGLLSGTPLAAVLFGAKMFLPFLAGYLAMRKDYLASSLFTWLYRILVPAIVVGIGLDVLLDLPWSGTTYEFAGVLIEVTRQWGTFGVERAAGFGRSSFESAICLYSLLALRLAAGRERPAVTTSAKSRVYDALVGSAAVVAVIVTTSKTTLLALLFLAMVALIHVTFQRSQSRLEWGARSALAVMFSCAFAYTLAPFLFLLGSSTWLEDVIADRGLVLRVLLQSFVERVQEVWPQAFATLSGPFTLWIGRGLGSVGASQLYFDPAGYNPADNVYVYMLLAFGLVVLASLLGYLLVLVFRLFGTRRPDAALVVFLSTILVFGATLNVVEAPALMMSLGLLLSTHEHLRQHGH
jgi:hypothetical protein